MKLRKILKFLFVISFFMIIFVGCEQPIIEKKNTPPVVTLSIPDTTFYSGDSIRFSACSTDADNDSLTYTWSVNGITQENETECTFILKKEVTYDKTFFIRVNVSDGKDSDSYSQEIHILRTPYTQEEVRNVINIKNLFITNSYFYSALKTSWINTSDKTVNYYYIDATAYNAVGDRVSSFIGKATGPYEHNQSSYLEWTYAFNDVTVDKILINNIKIVYSDNTTIRLKEEEVLLSFITDSPYNCYDVINYP